VLVNSCRVVGRLAGKDLTLVIDSDETRASPEYKALNPTNKFPLLETPEGNLQESHAIAKFLASSHATLMGANPVERA
jgi:glutathione S-transferase